LLMFSGIHDHAQRFCCHRKLITVSLLRFEGLTELDA
jgi:hypothetical protein